MLQLKENEKIIATVHRHWIALIGKIAMIVILIFAGVIGMSFMAVFIGGKSSIFYYLLWFLLSIYLSAVYLLTFIFWMDYYLDMWVITDKRILDIEQSGIFKREVSEFLISKVQDITIEIPGMTASLFRYGNIRVQTAGEQSFTAVSIPNPDKIKNVIMELVSHRQNNGTF